MTEQNHPSNVTKWLTDAAANAEKYPLLASEIYNRTLHVILIVDPLLSMLPLNVTSRSRRHRRDAIASTLFREPACQHARV